MTKEKENRFDGLMGAVRGKTNAQTSKPRNARDDYTESQAEVHSARSDVQKSRAKTSQPSSTTSDVEASDNSNTSTSKHSSIQTSKKAKSANPDYMRTTVYLPKKMHKKLKAIALEEEKEMSSIVEELIEAWLISQS